MKVAIIGATGRAGSQLLEEALRRGHAVTAIARHASAKLAPRPALAVVDADVCDFGALQSALRGNDAVFSAAPFTGLPTDAILEATRAAGVRRLLVVGGAASLKVASGARLLDTPDFPGSYRAEATAAAAYLDMLKKEHSIEWTFLSPPALIVQGPRTGHFRVGKDELLVDEHGRSTISFADYAIAYVDELENPRHVRQRFTVAY